MHMWVTITRMRMREEAGAGTDADIEGLRITLITLITGSQNTDMRDVSEQHTHTHTHTTHTHAPAAPMGEVGTSNYTL